jgi:rhodanese-related sulfurtransferase
MSSAEPGAIKEYHGLAISSDELRSKLSSRDESIMIFDIGYENHYKREHIPGSRFMVCDDKTISAMLPKMPKGIDIIFVGEDENYIKEMARWQGTNQDCKLGTSKVVLLHGSGKRLRNLIQELHLMTSSAPWMKASLIGISSCWM